ncbi:MAG: type II toxin-antitoxin system RelB/DinJ family antitoxin [bacterium]
MPKTEMIRARIEPDLKKEVERIFKELGLTTTEAIILFYNQIRLRKGLPFDVVIPNKTTVKTFRDTDAGKNLVYCDDAEDLFNKLGI